MWQAIHSAGNPTQKKCFLPLPEDLCSTSTPAPSSSEFSPNPAPAHPVPPPLLLHAKLPNTPEQLDHFIQVNITPNVMHQEDVNVMQHVITHDLYSYLVSQWKFGVTLANQHHQRQQRDNAPAATRNAMHEVTEETKRTKKKKLRQLRRCGSSPEEIKLLAE